jgi:hypothetical protein
MSEQQTNAPVWPVPTPNLIRQVHAHLAAQGVATGLSPAAFYYAGPGGTLLRETLASLESILDGAFGPGGNLTNNAAVEASLAIDVLKSLLDALLASHSAAR